MLTKLVTAPAAEPLTLADAKEYLRIDTTADDNQITMMIKAARSMIENFIDRKLITQDWLIYWDRWPMQNANMWWDGTKDMAITELVSQQRYLDIPFGPIQSVTSFKTYDNDDTANTEDLTKYVIDNKGPNGRISLRLGNVWPTTVLRPANGIEVQVKVGYGDTSADVPNDILFAMKQLVAFMYENRGDVSDVKMPPMMEMLLNPYKRLKVARV